MADECVQIGDTAPPEPVTGEWVSYRQVRELDLFALTAALTDKPSKRPWSEKSDYGKHHHKEECQCDQCYPPASNTKE